MNSQKSKVNKIKLCLKKGIPVAVIAAGVVAAANGCEDNSSKQPICQQKSTDIPDKDAVAFVGMVQAPPIVIATIKLDDSDFNKDLTNLSKAGEKKLNNFINQLSETEPLHVLEYDIIAIDFSEKDAGRERKKAKAMFDKYSSYLCIFPGIVLTKDFIIGSEIAWRLKQEFNLKPKQLSIEELLEQKFNLKPNQLKELLDSF